MNKQDFDELVEHADTLHKEIVRLRTENNQLKRQRDTFREEVQRLTQHQSPRQRAVQNLKEDLEGFDDEEAKQIIAEAIGDDDR